MCCVRSWCWRGRGLSETRGGERERSVGGWLIGARQSGVQRARVDARGSERRGNELSERVYALRRVAQGTRAEKAVASAWAGRGQAPWRQRSTHSPLHQPPKAGDPLLTLLCLCLTSYNSTYETPSCPWRNTRTRENKYATRAPCSSTSVDELIPLPLVSLDLNIAHPTRSLTRLLTSLFSLPREAPQLAYPRLTRLAGLDSTVARQKAAPVHASLTGGKAPKKRHAVAIKKSPSTSIAAALALSLCVRSGSTRRGLTSSSRGLRKSPFFLCSFTPTQPLRLTHADLVILPRSPRFRRVVRDIAQDMKAEFRWQASTLMAAAGGGRGLSRLSLLRHPALLHSRQASHHRPLGPQTV